MLLKRASCFLSFFDPETYFYFLRKYKLQLKTYYLNMLLPPVIIIHTEEKWLYKEMCQSLG